jgi:undecaprenyl-diphosphatase
VVLSDWIVLCDRIIVQFVNSFAHRWVVLDTVISSLAFNPLFKGGVFMAVFCSVWFQFPEKTVGAAMTEKRQILLYSLLMCIPGLVIARALASELPFRQRPLFNFDLHLRHAFTLDAGGLEPWSSFPSDHGVLFFALATAVFLVSRKAGWLLYLYATLFVALPRIFLGIHYPSDILAGALFGSGLAYSARWSAWRSLVTRPAMHLQELSPGLFYAFFFLLVYQTAVLYDPLRATAVVGQKITLALFH